MEKIPPEQAMEILRKGGLEVDIHQTRQILDFLYKLTNIVLAKCLQEPP